MSLDYLLVCNKKNQTLPKISESFIYFSGASISIYKALFSHLTTNRIPILHSLFDEILFVRNIHLANIYYKSIDFEKSGVF